MKMRAEPRVLLTIALLLASSSGCGEGTSTDDDLDAQLPQPTYDSATGPVTAGGNDAGVSNPGTQPTGQTDSGSAPTPTLDSGTSGGKTDASTPSMGSDASAPTPQTDSSTPAQGDAGPTTPTDPGNVPPADSTDKDGPFAPTHITNGGPKGTSWVFYPMDLGKNGMKHPVFNWGPGAGTGPKEYTDHLNRLASHGFVVISQPSSGTGADEVPALDWLIAQNDKSGSPFYQKLDTKKVGAGGHSKGALTTMKMSKDPRLTLYVLVCGGGSGNSGADGIHGPTVILGGDTDIGTPNFEGDYNQIKSPVVFLTKNGTDHIACARNNLSPWTAFMRWHFYGEDKWKPKFFSDGEFCKTPWKCKSKGF